jgi:low affinity Fe/Cu permease
MASLRERNKIKLEKSADKATRWIGSTSSLVVHTLLFIAAFVLPFLGIPFERILLILTTAVSLEAIYLAIFIQMSVNKNTKDIEIIQEDVEEIQEDVEGIEKDVDEIQKDVEEIQEDVEDIEEDSTEDQKIEQKEAQAITAIQTILSQLQREIEQLKNKQP